MPEMLRVRNWSKFQHYKDRNPPWIKLHFELLSSEDWVVLDDASRVLAVACMLVASRNEGFVRVDEKGRKYIQRVAYLNAAADFKPLIECGFLTDASGNLADASAVLADARPETETEAKKEQGAPSAPDRFPDFWSAYPKKREKKKARDAWKRKRLDSRADEIISDVQNRIKNDGQWLDGYVPHPTTYINGERWEDEIEPPRGADGKREPRPPHLRALS